jgi:outer membrane lipopolysaccharide assembly protein LptE/RlpB
MRMKLHLLVLTGLVLLLAACARETQPAHTG